MTITTQWPYDEPVFSGLFSPQFTNTILKEFDKPFEKVYDIKTTYPYDMVMVREEDELKKYILSFAISGFTKEDISVNVIDDELRIEVKNNSECKCECDDKCKDDCGCIDDRIKEEYVHHGIAHRDMKVSFKIGSLVDNENITMKYVNGLLSIDIPVKQKEIHEISFK